MGGEDVCIRMVFAVRLGPVWGLGGERYFESELFPLLRWCV